MRLGSPWDGVSGPTASAGMPIVHADDAWIVIDKPAGLPSVPGRTAALQDCAATRVQALYPDAQIVHRLDMATSGLLLLARGKLYQRTLGMAFANREVEKIYVAVVLGEVAHDSGEIDQPLGADWACRPRQQVDPEHGKPSLTRWRVIGRGAGQTRLELLALTGRSHQLRVHLSHIGHPIVGDTLYAPPELAQATRLMLHARQLALRHPASGQMAIFESPAPF